MKAAEVRWATPAELPEGRSLIEEVVRRRGHEMTALVNPVVDDPRGIHDMEKGAALIASAIRERRVFGVYGDYDADGVTSTAAITRALRSAGAKVIPYVPNRRLGYGVSDLGFQRLREAGVEFVVVVDSGTNGQQAIQAGKRMGLTIVVLDHHPVDPTLVSAPHALVNPQMPGSRGDFGHTSGAGVAYQMCRVLADDGVLELHPGLSALAAVGIVADVMPLIGVNRVVVREGLANIQAVPGLAALARKAHLRRVSAEDVAFDLAPRLNAAGRMSDPRAALALLLVNEPFEAAQLATHLDGLNSERRKEQDRCEHLCHDIVSGLPEKSRAIFVASAEIPSGIAGPVASRLAERYQRPAFVGFVDQEMGVIRGSARTASGISPIALLDHAKESLPDLVGGGHQAAAGFTVRIEDCVRLAQLLDERARELTAGRDLCTSMAADILLSRLLTVEEEQDLWAMGPWGKGFEPPIIVSRNLVVTGRRNMSDRYGELYVTDGLRRMSITAFEPLTSEVGASVTVAYKLSEGRGMKLAGIRVRARDIESPPLSSSESSELGV